MDLGIPVPSSLFPESGGIILRLDREQWGYSVFAAAKEGVLSRFSAEDIEVTLRRVPPMRDDGRTPVERLRSRNDVLYVRSVATSGDYGA